MKIPGLALSLVLACGRTPPKDPAAPAPETDWTTVLRQMALAGLRAMVCTDPPRPDAATEPDAGVP